MASPRSVAHRVLRDEVAVGAEHRLGEADERIGGEQRLGFGVELEHAHHDESVGAVAAHTLGMGREGLVDQLAQPRRPLRQHARQEGDPVAVEARAGVLPLGRAEHLAGNRPAGIAARAGLGGAGPTQRPIPQWRWRPPWRDPPPRRPLPIRARRHAALLGRSRRRLGQNRSCRALAVHWQPRAPAGSRPWTRRISPSTSSSPRSTSPAGSSTTMSGTATAFLATT